MSPLTAYSALFGIVVGLWIAAHHLILWFLTALFSVVFR